LVSKSSEKLQIFEKVGKKFGQKKQLKRNLKKYFFCILGPMEGREGYIFPET
jgi:hypothetical protein